MMFLSRGRAVLADQLFTRFCMSAGSLALACALFHGCGVPPPVMSIHTTRFPLEGPCPEDNSAGEFTDEITSLRVLIDGPDLSEPFEASGPLGTLVVEDVPAGEDRTIVLYGNTDQPGVWRGVRKNVTIESGEDNSVDILLSKVADLSCPRSTQTSARAFHTATVLNDGRILLVGGANEDRDASATCEGCSRINASGTAEIYNPATGTFTSAGQMELPRMFHTATLMDDGRVAVIGGITEALIVPASAASPFPIQIRTEPVALIEIFDPESVTFSSALDDPNGGRVFHAATKTTNGALVISGGIPSQPNAGDLSNALTSVTLCEPALGSCLNTAPLAYGRAGHGMFTLPSGDVLVWGGSVSDDEDGYSPELISASTGDTQVLTIRGFRNSSLNLFFAAHSQYIDFRILAAGGLVRTANGFALSSLDVSGSPRGPAYIFDASGDDTAAWLLSAGQSDSPRLVIESPRFLASAMRFPDGRRALIAGGFNTLSLAPSAALDLFDEDTLAISPITVAGSPRSLRQARGGLVAVGAADGAILLSGGETSTAGQRSPMTTSEIFQDPKDPLEVR